MNTRKNSKNNGIFHPHGRKPGELCLAQEDDLGTTYEAKLDNMTIYIYEASYDKEIMVAPLTRIPEKLTGDLIKGRTERE